MYCRYSDDSHVARSLHPQPAARSNKGTLHAAPGACFGLVKSTNDDMAKGRRVAGGWQEVWSAGERRLVVILGPVTTSPEHKVAGVNYLSLLIMDAS